MGYPTRKRSSLISRPTSGDSRATCSRKLRGNTLSHTPVTSLLVLSLYAGQAWGMTEWCPASPDGLNSWFRILRGWVYGKVFRTATLMVSACGGWILLVVPERKYYLFTLRATL